MRRSICIAFLVAATVLAGSQALAAKSAPLTEEERTAIKVFEVPGHTKDQVYSAARTWVAENFKSAKAVIELEDKDAGVIVGNGRTPFTCEGGWVCRQKANTWILVFKMKFEAKDGRFRLTFTDVYVDGRAGGYEIPIKDREDVESAKRTLLAMGDSIVASMDRKAAEDW